MTRGGGSVVRMRWAALLLLPLLLASPASAAGTGGIEVDPYPGVVDGHQVTAFHVQVPSSGRVQVRYSLRNTTDAPVHGRLYGAAASSDGHGGWTVGGAGSSSYLDLPVADVTLAPHEVRLASFTVHGPVSNTRYAAVVVEVKQGSVVARAATLVYLRRGRTVPLPLLLVLGAGLLVVAGALALGRTRRRPATLG